MWAPQPAHVNLPQLLHGVFQHILLVERVDGRAAGSISKSSKREVHTPTQFRGSAATQKQALRDHERGDGRLGLGRTAARAAATCFAASASSAAAVAAAVARAARRLAYTSSTVLSTSAAAGDDGHGHRRRLGDATRRRGHAVRADHAGAEEEALALHAVRLQQLLLKAAADAAGANDAASACSAIASAECIYID